MFNRKHKRIREIFDTLLLKLSKHPTDIQESDVVSLYKRAVDIHKSLDNLESVYNITGSTDYNMEEE